MSDIVHHSEIDQALNRIRIWAESYNVAQHAKKTVFQGWPLDGPGGRAYPEMSMGDHCKSCHDTIESLSLAAELFIVENPVLNSGHRIPEDLSLFLYGSLARLDFLAGSSDIDLIAVRNSQKESDWVFVKKTNDFESFSTSLESAIKTAVEESSGVKTRRVTVYGSSEKTRRQPSDKRAPPESDRSLTLGGLTMFAGKNTEGGWTSSRRAGLLFESVVVWPLMQPNDDAIRSKIDSSVYGIIDDLMLRRFPVQGVLLSRQFLYSGLQSKANIVRTSKRPEKTARELAKASHARLWSGVLNELTLIGLWCSARFSEKKYTRTDFLLHLRKAPMERLLISFSDYFESSNNGILKQFGRDSEVYQSLEIVKQLVINVTSGRVPLWYRYSQAMRLYHEIREGRPIGPDDLQAFSVWNQELTEVWMAIGRLSRLIMGANIETTPVYLIYHMISDHLHMQRPIRFEGSTR